MRLKSTQMDLKIHENWVILEGPGNNFWRSEACWVRFALPESLGAVSGAVVGGCWALLGAVLGCPGRQLAAKLAPEADKHDLENWALFGHPLAPPFSGFSCILVANMSPCWRQSRIWKRSYVKTA